MKIKKWKTADEEMEVDEEVMEEEAVRKEVVESREGESVPTTLPPRERTEVEEAESEAGAAVESAPRDPRCLKIPEERWDLREKVRRQPTVVVSSPTVRKPPSDREKDGPKLAVYWRWGLLSLDPSWRCRAP